MALISYIQTCCIVLDHVIQVYSAKFRMMCIFIDIHVLYCSVGRITINKL